MKVKFTIKTSSVSIRLIIVTDSKCAKSKMNQIFFSFFVIYFNSIEVTIFAQNNNVCPSFRDYYSMSNNSNCWYNFAAELRVPDIIKRTGYPFMEYKIKTRDGYILTLFRIPSLNKKKEPIFLLHGMQSTSGIFVGNGKDSLGFVLSDAGHDVWLGNYRGTAYSEEHETLDATKKEYWNYGVDEIALLDVPTMLQAVSFHTGDKGNIIYIGHSLGTTAALMYASEYPDHAKRMVKAFILLSPSYTLTNMRSPYRIMFPLMRSLVGVSQNLNVVQLFSGSSIRRITKPTCLSSPAVMLMCFMTLNLFLGPFNQVAPETIPVLFNEFPGGTSLKTVLYLQDAVRGNFRKFDYGSNNMIIYGTTEPPSYNISKIQVPVVLFYSENDWATTKADALNLYNKLPKNKKNAKYEVPVFNFNHVDFVFGRNAKALVYERILKVIKDFSNCSCWCYS